ATWLGLPSETTNLRGLMAGDHEAVHACLPMFSPSGAALRTPAWLLWQPAAGDPQLYAKPSDRWEVNEVARLCPEVVDGMQSLLADISRSGSAAAAQPLSQLLAAIVD